MTHLEQLVYEYYDWQGYLVKHNMRVGRRLRGGHDMEFDIVAYNPHTKHLVHIEPSIDAHSWAKREFRFKKKFENGEKYITKEVFSWLDKDVVIDQKAILITHTKGREKIGGGRIISIDEFLKVVGEKIKKEGAAESNAIPEQYPLLRTIQFVLNGYHKSLIYNL